MQIEKRDRRGRRDGEIKRLTFPLKGWVLLTKVHLLVSAWKLTCPTVSPEAIWMMNNLTKWFQTSQLPIGSFSSHLEVGFNPSLVWFPLPAKLPPLVFSRKNLGCHLRTSKTQCSISLLLNSFWRLATYWVQSAFCELDWSCLRRQFSEC